MKLYVSYSHSTNEGQRHGFGSTILSNWEAPKDSAEVADLRSRIETDFPENTVVVIITWHELKG